MHPYLPLPVNFDTAVPAGWGLLEWHIVVTPDLDTLLMALPANSNAEFQMGDDEEDDGSEQVNDSSGGEGVPADALLQGLPATDGTPWEDEEGPDDGGLGSVLPHLRGLNKISPVRWRL